MGISTKIQPVAFSYKATVRDEVELAFRKFYKSFSTWLLYVILAGTAIRCVIDHVAVKDASISIGIVLLIIIGMHVWLYFHTRNLFEESRAAKEEAHWKIKEPNIEINRSSASVNLAWNKIVKLVIISNWVLLYYNKEQFYYFPKDKISDDQLSEIQKWFDKSRIKY